MQSMLEVLFIVWICIPAYVALLSASAFIGRTAAMYAVMRWFMKGREGQDG